MFKVLASLVFALSIGLACAQATQPHLPIYIEDSHAGSFYWCAQNLPLDDEFTLVLFDAHSDATQLFDSDQVRKKVREPVLSKHRMELLNKWRQKGVIQCFNWIEPLMPKPFAEVIWIVPDDGKPKSERRIEINKELNAHQIVVPRKANLDQRFQLYQDSSKLSDLSPKHPVAVSLDLDFFAHYDDTETLAKSFNDLFDQILSIPKLTAITIAISRPYLESQQQAEHLMQLLFEQLTLLPNSRIHYEPYATIGEDRSRKAIDLLKQGKQIPQFNPELVTNQALRQVWKQHSDQIYVIGNQNRWQQYLSTIKSGPKLKVTSNSIDFDGCYRVTNSRPHELRLTNFDPDQSIQWQVLNWHSDAHNLLGQPSSFAPNADSIMRWQITPINSDRPWLDFADWQQHLGYDNCGTIRIRAKVGNCLSNTITIRCSKAAGFKGAIQESFNLPYALGGSLLKNKQATGPNCALGGDCANLAVYAYRRQHLYLPWCTPPQLRSLLDKKSLQENFTQPELEAGLLIDLGGHIAILYQDTSPKGKLNESDLVVHHLGGQVEVLTYQELCEKHDQTPRQFLLPHKTSTDSCKITIVGDTMPARSIGQQADNPFKFITEQLQYADLCIANLECAIADSNSQTTNQPLTFVAPPKAKKWLDQSGIDVVSLANNHSLDGGNELLKSMQQKLKSFGSADQPTLIHTINNGLRVGLIGIHGSQYSTEALIDLTKQSDFQIAYLHWGTEHTAEVDNYQIKLAQDLIDKGIDLVVGTGPHQIQNSDQYKSVPIFYSLGNFVFDGKGPNPQWSQGQLLNVWVNQKTKTLERISTEPVMIDSRGFPKSANQ